MRFVHRILFGLLILLSPAAAAEQLTDTLSAADRYSGDIHARFGTGDDPQEATAFRLAGATAAQAGETDAAIASYERAIALGGGTAETWLELAKLQRDREGGWSAVGAAYYAYALASDAGARGDALDLLGSLLQALDKPAEALAAYQLAVTEAPENDYYQERVAYLTDLVGLHVDNVEVDRSNDTPRFCFTFNAAVLDVRQVHYEKFVAAEPAFTPVFSTIGASLCINGAEYGKTYKITLAAGMPSAENRALVEAESFDLESGDRDPSLGFDGTAYVLPKASGHGVPLVSVNLDHARLELLRVNDRNLVREIDESRLLRAVDGYDRDDIVRRYGALLWSGDVLIENEPNQRVVTSVPLDEMLPDTEPGVYLLLVSLPSQTEDEPWSLRATQWLVVTDLGLTAMTGGNGLDLFVRSLETGEPLGRAEAKLDRKSTRLNSSHIQKSRMPSSA